MGPLCMHEESSACKQFACTINRLEMQPIQNYLPWRYSPEGNLFNTYPLLSPCWSLQASHGTGCQIFYQWSSFFFHCALCMPFQSGSRMARDDHFSSIQISSARWGFPIWGHQLLLGNKRQYISVTRHKSALHSTMFLLRISAAKWRDLL